jgi:hypothetical protein
MGVAAPFGLLLGVVQLGAELFVFGVQFWSSVGNFVAQHYININMEEAVEQQYYVSPIANPVAGDKLLSKILKLTKARTINLYSVNE